MNLQRVCVRLEHRSYPDQKQRAQFLVFKAKLRRHFVICNEHTARGAVQVKALDSNAWILVPREALDSICPMNSRPRSLDSGIQALKFSI